LQQEVDLFHFRILCQGNASIRDFLSQNNITYESISEYEKEHQWKQLFDGGHSAEVKYFKNEEIASIFKLFHQNPKIEIAFQPSAGTKCLIPRFLSY
ncbi:hypothetical protein T08_2027, partial [Trichinella sp. T8]